MRKPRLVVPLTIQFSVRYLLRTGLLAKLENFANVIVLLGWKDDCLRDELATLKYEVYDLPKTQMTVDFARLRKKIHISHFNRVNCVSTRIDRSRQLIRLSWPDRFRSMTRNSLYDLLGTWPGKFDQWLQIEQQTLLQETNFSAYLSLVQSTNPDLIFSVTPYFLEEEFLLRAGAQSRAKLITAILSFDNLTTRPRIPVLFDKYLLWNEYNRREVMRIYRKVKPEHLELVGAPQFDFYYDPSYCWDELTWRNLLGIPGGRPVILFGAGPETITPVEPHILRQLDEAIEQGQFPNRPIILLRLHPVDTTARWEALCKSAKNIIFDIPWKLGQEVVGKTNISRYDIEKLVSSLKYSLVHINTSSTMTLDGAIFDRPQIGPAYDDRPGKKYDRAMRELYLREHYLPITESGGLQIAYSFEQLKNYILNAFQHPERHRAERKNMVRALGTYDDGKSTQRVASAVKRFLHEN